MIGLDKESMTINPTLNEDGTTTYLPGAIQVRLAAPEKMFDFSKVDATNAKFRIFYSNNAFETVSLDYDQFTATATSNAEVTIPTSNYLITLTGIVYNSVPVGSIEVIRSSEISEGILDPQPPEISYEPMSGEAVTKLIILSVTMLSLLGMLLS